METAGAGRTRNPVLWASVLVTGLCNWAPPSHAASDTAVPLVASLSGQQGFEPGFLKGHSIVQHRQRRFGMGIRYTIRLPSGTVAAPATAWSSEVHAAGNLAATSGIPGFSVPTLHGSWYSRSGYWRLSAWVTDITRENLFTNISDLSTTDANRLQQWPDRHWWFSLERRF